MRLISAGVNCTKSTVRWKSGFCLDMENIGGATQSIPCKVSENTLANTFGTVDVCGWGRNNSASEMAGGVYAAALGFLGWEGCVRFFAMSRNLSLSIWETN